MFTVSANCVTAEVSVNVAVAVIPPVPLLLACTVCAPPIEEDGTLKVAENVPVAEVVIVVGDVVTAAPS